MPEREQTPESKAACLWKATDLLAECAAAPRAGDKQAEAIYLMLLPEVAKAKAAMTHQ